jgi:hypothetical protein
VCVQVYDSGRGCRHGAQAPRQRQLARQLIRRLATTSRSSPCSPSPSLKSLLKGPDCAGPVALLARPSPAAAAAWCAGVHATAALVLHEAAEAVAEAAAQPAPAEAAVAAEARGSAAASGDDLAVRARALRAERDDHVRSFLECYRVGLGEEPAACAGVRGGVPASSRTSHVVHQLCRPGGSVATRPGGLVVSQIPRPWLNLVFTTIVVKIVIVIIVVFIVILLLLL